MSEALVLNNFQLLSNEELETIDAGGFLETLAGGIAAVISCVTTVAPYLKTATAAIITVASAHPVIGACIVVGAVCGAIAGVAAIAGH